MNLLALMISYSRQRSKWILEKKERCAGPGIMENGGMLRQCKAAWCGWSSESQREELRLWEGWGASLRLIAGVRKPTEKTNIIFTLNRGWLNCTWVIQKKIFVAWIHSNIYVMCWHYQHIGSWWVCNPFLFKRASPLFKNWEELA